MTSIAIAPDTPADLADYARVPSAFTVREAFAVGAPGNGLGGLQLVLRPVEPAWVKDYDAMPGNHPTDWPLRFDMNRWRILSAWDGDTRVGGACVICPERPAGLESGEEPVGVLHDIRVAPAWRGRGVGRQLFDAAVSLAGALGARWVDVETQTINVRACRFYARLGCVLTAIDRLAYPRRLDETLLRWRFDVDIRV